MNTTNITRLEMTRESMRNPKGPKTGLTRGRRGGAWSNGADDCRSACRDWNHPGFRFDYLGFRLARRIQK